MGVCFTFTGTRISKCLLASTISLSIGIGSFVGNPIAGALLTSTFQWWRPITFAAVSLSLSLMSYLLSFFLYNPIRS